ncbi:MAG: NifB/NifX family molybdenum-iron cluster-binding protein [Clostridia bacterium]
MSLKAKDIVRIAVTYENGEIFQHFGQTTQFKIYDTIGDEITRSEVVAPKGASHCSLGSWLYENHVHVLICGSLGAGASKSLQAAGILVYGGNSGSADEAVSKLLRKELLYNPVPSCGGHHDHGCDHHDEETADSCAGHNCYGGGHNHKDEENAGHNHRAGHQR